MATLLRLAFRQLYSAKRLAIIALLTLGPVVLSIIIVTTAENADPDEFVEFIIDGMILSAILPLIVLAFATTAFGSDVEDRTLSQIVLKPIRTWQIVLPKFAAALALSAVPILASGIVTAAIGIDAELGTLVPIAVALTAGVITYSAIFLWAGLVSTRALAFGLIYVFIWEGVLSRFLSGIRLFSVKGYVLGILDALGGDRFQAVSDRAIEPTAAVVGVIVVSSVFIALTVHRLRTMDVT